MIKKILITALLPFIILIFLYYSTKTTTHQANLRRSFLKDIKLNVIDTIDLNNGNEIDGITIDNGNLYLNKRNSIVKLSIKGKKELPIPIKKYGTQNPVVGLAVENDTIYYYHANTREINAYDNINHKDLQSYKFNFPITYFTKLQKKIFIYQENVVPLGSVQVHTINYLNNEHKIDKTIFPQVSGDGMRHSGSWFGSADRNHFFSSIFLMIRSIFLIKMEISSTP